MNDWNHSAPISLRKTILAGSVKSLFTWDDWNRSSIKLPNFQLGYCLCQDQQHHPREHTHRGEKNPNHKTINGTTHKWSQIAKPFLSKDHLWDKYSEQDKSWGSRYCIKSWRSGEIQEYTNNSSLLRRWMQWMFLKAAITANNCVAVKPGGLTQVPGEGARHTLEGGSCSGELSHRA